MHLKLEVLKPVLIRDQGNISGEIIIEEDVWLATNVTVLAGVRIKRGSIVAAGAVVTHNVEPYTIVGGVPAQIIRKRVGVLKEESS